MPLSTDNPPNKLLFLAYTEGLPSPWVFTGITTLSLLEQTEQILANCGLTPYPFQVEASLACESAEYLNKLNHAIAQKNFLNIPLDLDKPLHHDPQEVLSLLNNLAGLISNTTFTSYSPAQEITIASIHSYLSSSQASLNHEEAARTTTTRTKHGDTMAYKASAGTASAKDATDSANATEHDDKLAPGKDPYSKFSFPIVNIPVA